jgi:hypothetical protein
MLSKSYRRIIHKFWENYCDSGQVDRLFSTIESHLQRFCEYDLIVNFSFFYSELINFLEFDYPEVFYLWRIFQRISLRQPKLLYWWVIAYCQCDGLIFDVVEFLIWYLLLHITYSLLLVDCLGVKTLCIKARFLLRKRGHFY